MERPEFIRLSEILVAPKPSQPLRLPRPQLATLTHRHPPQVRSPSLTMPPSAAAEAKANDLLKQIHDGANFEDIAKKSSDGPSAADGGALGMFKRGQLAKELEDKTFAIKTGEVTDVIRTKQGYVILKVEDHQQAGIPPMKDVLPKIQDALYYQKLQPALRAYLTKLREDAYIEIRAGLCRHRSQPQPDPPVETASAQNRRQEVGRKKHKKLGFL